MRSIASIGKSWKRMTCLDKGLEFNLDSRDAFFFTRLAPIA